MPSKAKQIYWAVRRVLTQPPGAMVERWESMTGDRVLPEDHFQTAVYYADGPVNLYQLRQWYEPLKALDAEAPVVLVCRSVTAALDLLEESPFPVVYAARVEDLENLVERQRFSLALYVNQNTRNFQMMRYGRRWHVFVNHGESDKMYMTSNQFKTYDYAFVAGDAAKARLSRALWDYDVEKRTIEIGRPQADHFGGDAPYPSDDRMVVLYSPTWEGDRPTATYGSVASHGERLVNALLASGRHRVIYRPHPRSGVVDPEFGAANERIIAAIGAANEADPSAHHIFDQSPSIGWQLALSDVAICDISAMIYDRLATGRPLMVTRPANPEAEVDEQGYLSECEWLTVDDASNAVAVLDRVHGDPDARDHVAQWSTRYFGDTTPGAPTKRFHAAIDTLMDRWEAWNCGEGVIR